MLYDKYPDEKTNSFRVTNNFLPGILRTTSTRDGIRELLDTVIDHPDSKVYASLQLYDSQEDCGICQWFQVKPLVVTTAEEKNETAAETKNQNSTQIKLSTPADDFVDRFSINTGFGNDVYRYNRELILRLCDQYLDAPKKYLRLEYVVDQPAGPKISEALEQSMRSYVAQYKIEVVAAQGHYEKIKAIASLIRNCERLHPFADGNTRTFSMLLLNHLLIQNGFPPVIRDNPNKCYAITLDDFATDIIAGMNRTIGLAQGIKPYGVETDEILSKSDNVGLSSFKRALEIESKSRTTHSTMILPQSISNTNADTKSESSSQIKSEVDDLKSKPLNERKKIRDERILRKMKMPNEVENFALALNNLKFPLELLSTDEAKLEYISIINRYITCFTVADMNEMLPLMPMSARLNVIEKWLPVQKQNADQKSLSDWCNMLSDTDRPGYIALLNSYGFNIDNLEFKKESENLSSTKKTDLPTVSSGPGLFGYTHPKNLDDCKETEDSNKPEKHSDANIKSSYPCFIM